MSGPDEPMTLPAVSVAAAGLIRLARSGVLDADLSALTAATLALAVDDRARVLQAVAVIAGLLAEQLPDGIREVILNHYEQGEVNHGG